MSEQCKDVRHTLWAVIVAGVGAVAFTYALFQLLLSIFTTHSVLVTIIPMYDQQLINVLIVFALTFDVAAIWYAAEALWSMRRAALTAKARGGGANE